MNEDEPKWLELWHENTTRYIRFSDALIITKNDFLGRLEVLTALRTEPMTAQRIFVCDFFGRRQSELFS